MNHTNFGKERTYNGLLIRISTYFGIHYIVLYIILLYYIFYTKLFYKYNFFIFFLKVSKILSIILYFYY